MIHLITQFFKVNYNSIDSKLIRKRQDEITHCFKVNLLHKDVEKIHFLYEKEDDVEFLKKEGIDIHHNKIILYNLGCRLKYSLIFNYANEFLKDKICVYLHADMCIHSGFNKLNLNNTDNKLYSLTSHNTNCNGKLNCNCTRQFHTSRGLYGVTFDGFVFKSPINEKIINEANHHVQRLGGENRLICIFKDYNYVVECPNQVLKCIHHHKIKIFNNMTKDYWITRNGEDKPQNYYSHIHKIQKNKSWDDKIVGGGIPFFKGSCKFINNL